MLGDLEKKEQQLKKDLEVEVTDKKKQELLRIDEIITAINKLKDVEDSSKIDQITNILKKMDSDKDGSLKAENVIKMIGTENVKLTSKQIDELIDLLEKEEILEVEDKIEKALQKDKEATDAQLQAGKCGCETTDDSLENKGKNPEKNTVCSTTPPKPKMDTKPIVTPPSIEKPKSGSSSKML
ncbi:hypothetical protein NQ317_002372 [Molorchus minor]|uniref:EF-hand domain-containing protein n=1 Tax=Molorchus minor TaxID=1323400 RepID=A0ABQ9JUN7_9CUCU|nr:hypothetical protein NQ317_002372 [Molorchus minor]